MIIDKIFKNDVVNLAIDTLKKDKQALVFVSSKKSAEKQAEEIANKNKPKDARLSELANEVLKIFSRPTKQCIRLSECIKGGTAFHHSGLNFKQRELVEDAFRQGIIKIICSTPTLAAGLDMPAFRTIIKTLKRYSQRGMQAIPVLEYLQMAGRAGRPKYDGWGEAICIASSENEAKEITDMYINGVPEEIYSKLAAEPVLRMHVLSLIAGGLVKDKETLLEFFSKTFFAHQYKDMERIESILTKVLSCLEDWKMIRSTKDEGDFVSASNLDKTYIPTLVGKRVAELYLDPLTANNLIKGMKKDKEKNDFSYLHLISNTLEMRPLLRVGTKEFEAIQEKWVKMESYLLQEFYDDPDYFEDSIKTAWFLEEWINEMDEEYLLEKFNIRPGEIKYKTDIADWLLFSMQEIAKALLLNEEKLNVTKLRTRVKYGVKEELLPLLKIKGIGKNRARKLYQNHIRSIPDLKKATPEMLKHLLGDKTSQKIIKQINYK